MTGCGSSTKKAQKHGQTQTFVAVWGLSIFIYEEEDIRTDGWAAIQKAVELSPAGVDIVDIEVTSERAFMVAGRREDMKAIWYAVDVWTVTSDRGVVGYDKRYVETEEGWEGDAGKWLGAGLDKIINMGEEDWQREVSRFKKDGPLQSCGITS